VPSVLGPHYLIAYFEMFGSNDEVLRRRQAGCGKTDAPSAMERSSGSGIPFEREALPPATSASTASRNSMELAGDRGLRPRCLYEARPQCALEQFSEEGSSTRVTSGMARTGRPGGPVGRH